MDHSSISTLISLLARRHRALAAELIEPLGLAPGQESLLMLLAEEEPVSQAHVARTLGIEAATVTKMVERMERNGLVERTRSAHDRRIVLVSRTERARERHADLLAAWARLDRLTLEGLTADDSRRLSALLAMLLHNVDSARP